MLPVFLVKIYFEDQLIVIGLMTILAVLLYCSIIWKFDKEVHSFVPNKIKKKFNLAV